MREDVTALGESSVEAGGELNGDGSFLFLIRELAFYGDLSIFWTKY